MTHILHRQMRTALAVAVHARGITITDATGKEYIDATGGAAVSCLGHAHPDVLAAMHAQIDRIVERLSTAVDAALESLQVRQTASA